MAGNKTTFTIAGSLILDAQANFKNIETAVASLGNKLKGLSFDDKTTRSMEVALGRISGLLPSLKSKLDQGIFDDRGLREYNTEIKMLTREMDTLSRQFRGINGSKLSFDDPKLAQYQETIKSLKAELKGMQKAPTLNVAALTGTKADTDEILKSINQATKSGTSLVATVAGLKTNYEQAVDQQQKYLTGAKTAEAEAAKEVAKAKEKLELFKRIQTALEEQQKRSGPQGQELNADLKEARKLDDNFKNLSTNAQKTEAAKKQVAQATLEQEQADNKHATAIKNVEVHTNKYLQAANKVHNIELFAGDNMGQLQAFDAKVADLASKLQLNEEEALALRQALVEVAQTTLETISQELGGMSGAIKTNIEDTNDLTDAQKKEKAATDQAKEAFKSKIAQMFGLYNIYQLIRRGIQDAYRSIKELDSAMNEIAVVTNMTTDELWGQINTYMAVAKQYGVATQGVYEVSKLYYQQGRDTAEVTKLTGETLKMAKIAGIDYAKATDNMTVALNGFKLSAQDASTVVDVYSQLAARSAVDTEELAYAMSKTASIAESAGMSFQNTSVFLAQMIETTREAPENIGTAMKTIIARFQEMKKSPLELLDVEGEEVSFNRVDAALKSIGMTLQDASGQFRDLDEVIYELAGRWDGLDRNTQRYIATIVAGSRQQSRFLALMQDSDRLLELQQEAFNSEDAGLVQYAKTLDSIESKLAQLRTSIQQLYMGIINGPLIKWIIDLGTKFTTFFNNLPKAISTTMIPGLFIVIRGALRAIGLFVINTFKKVGQQEIAENRKVVATYVKDKLAGVKAYLAGKKALEAGAAAQEVTTQATKSMSLGTVTGAMMGPVGWALTAVSLISTVYGIIQQSTEEMKTVGQRIQEFQDDVEKKNITRATAKSEYDEIVSLKKKYEELTKSKNNNNETYQEWLSLNQQIYEKYPDLLDYIDNEGNAIVKLGQQYETLTTQKRDAYDLAQQELIIATIQGQRNAATAFKDYIPSYIKTGESEFSEAAHIDTAKRAESQIKQAERSYADMKTLYEDTLNDFTGRGYTQEQAEFQAAQQKEGMKAAEQHLSGLKTVYQVAIDNIAPSAKNYDIASGQLSRVLDSAFEAMGEDATRADLLSQWSSDFIPAIFGDTQEYKNLLERYGQYTSDMGVEFLNTILDDSFDQLDTNQWTSQLIDLRGLLVSLGGSFEYVGSSVRRIQETAIDSRTKQWLFYDAPEGTKRGALYNESLRQSAQQEWESLLANTSDTRTEDQKWASFTALQKDILKDADLQLAKRIKSDEQFATSFATAQEYFVNSQQFSYQELLDYFNNPTLPAEIKKLFQDAETDEITILEQAKASNKERAQQIGQIFVDQGLETNLAQAKYDWAPGKGQSISGVDTSQLENELQSIPLTLQSSVTEQVTSLNKLLVSDSKDEISTSIKEGVNAGQLALDYFNIINEASKGGLNDAATLAIQAADVTTLSGLYNLISELKKTDAAGQALAEEIKAFADAGFQIATIAEANTNIAEYEKQRKEAEDKLSKPLTYSEQADLVSKRGFQWSDFDADGRVIDQNKAIKQYLSVYELLYTASMNFLQANDEQAYNAAVKIDNMSEQRKSEKRFLDFSKAVNAKDGTVGDISEELYLTLGSDQQSSFTRLLDGSYKFNGSLEKYYAFLNGLAAGVAEAGNEIDKIRAEQTASRESKLKGLADKMSNAYDVDSAQYIIDEGIKAELELLNIGTDEIFRRYFTETSKGWVANSATGYQEYINAVIKASGNQKLIEAIFADGAEETQKKIDDANKKAAQENRKNISSVLSSIDLENGVLRVGRDLFEQLGVNLQNMLTQVDMDSWELTNIENMQEFLQKALQQFDLSDPGAQAAIEKLKQTIQTSVIEYQESIYNLITKMLSDADSILEEAAKGRFASADVAKLIATKLKYTTKRSTTTGQDQFWDTQGVEVSAQDATLQFYREMGVNLHLNRKFVREEYKNLKEIGKLEAQLAKSQTEVFENNSDLLDEQIAKQYQWAKAIAATVFDPESYNFMSNSRTNEKLAPMYTLMENIGGAFEALGNARDNKGVAGIKDVNAILDYVDPNGTQFAALREMATHLAPPMEMTLTPSDIAALEDAVVKQAQADADKYNKEAENFNKFMDVVDSTDQTLKGDGVKYFTETFTTLDQMMSRLKETVGEDALNKSLETAYKILGEGFQADTPENAQKLVDTLVGVLTQDGILEDQQMQAATENLVQAMLANNTALTDLTAIMGGATEGLGELDPKNLTEAGEQASNVVPEFDAVTGAAASLKEGVDTAANSVVTFPEAVSTISTGLSSAATQASSFAEKVNSIRVPSAIGEGPSGANAADGGAISKSGKVLVGEFGPELAFANGRYQILGQSGPQFVNLPKGAHIFDHNKTRRILMGGTDQFTGKGISFAGGTGTYREEFGKIIVNIDLGEWQNQQGKPPRSGTTPNDKPGDTAEFDRWYNYLQILADIERSISEIQAARENLFGRDYVKSLAKEMSLIENQQIITGKFLADQEKYMKQLETNINDNKDFKGLIEVVDGVMQIDWNKINGMAKKDAEPIQEAIADWETMADAISESKQSLSSYEAQLREYQDEIRRGYVDTEKEVINAIKYRQQMVIDDLQAELDMKIKYDNKYLESLRKNIDAERKMRERSDSEEERVRLQRKLALLQRDTSGKSDLAIADTQRELQGMNRDAYDQRQDDFVQSEEDALVAAQEALQAEIEIQTEVLRLIDENIQLIQPAIDELMNSGTENLSNFLTTWNSEYLNSTPTAQIEMQRGIQDMAGKAQGYIDLGRERFDIPLSALKQNWLGDGKINTDPASTGSESPSTTTPTTTPSTGKKQTYWGIYSGGKRIRNSFRSEANALAMIEKEKTAAGNAMYGLRWKTDTKEYKDAQAKYNLYKNATVKKYAAGGLADYTGPALVHGSKQNPEAVLNPKQTGIFQQFVGLLDASFGQSIQNGMVKPNSVEGTPGSTTVIVENITLEAGLIAKDYDAKRAGNLVKEEILNIAKYKGNMTLKR